MKGRLQCMRLLTPRSSDDSLSKKMQNMPVSVQAAEDRMTEGGESFLDPTE